MGSEDSNAPGQTYEAPGSDGVVDEGDAADVMHVRHLLEAQMTSVAVNEHVYAAPDKAAANEKRCDVRRSCALLQDW